jgi:hypothetical protein
VERRLGAVKVMVYTLWHRVDLLTETVVHLWILGDEKRFFWRAAVLVGHFDTNELSIVQDGSVGDI